MGADPVACAALAGGAQVKAFFVRKETKQHGLMRRIEGPPLDADDRCLVVEDVVTTGGSTLRAIEALREAGHEICGAVCVLDRLAGGGEAIAEAAAAPYVALTTIDDMYRTVPTRRSRPAPGARETSAGRPEGRAHNALPEWPRCGTPPACR